MSAKHVSGTRRRPRVLITHSRGLGDSLADVADLSPDAQAALNGVIDGLIAKNRLRALADDIS